MTRRRAREAAVRLIYAQAASLQDPDALVDEYFEPEHLATLQDEEGAIAEAPGDEELAYIRSLVRRHAHGWRPERITRTAMAVLRCALTEILYLGDADVTPSVAINEAVELAKSFEEPETVSFINGVLGGFMRGEAGQDEAAAESAE